MKFPISKGFTLIELLVTVTILVIIIGAIYSTQVLSQRAYQEGEISIELTQNGRVILERIVREIRQANEIVTEFPAEEIIFEDGHTPIPSLYDQLGSDYYYIRYYVYTPEDPQEPKELRREYRVYCFDECQSQPDVCSTYLSWDDTKIEEEIEIFPHPCELEEKIIGEYLINLNFTGLEVIDISLTLSKNNKQIDLATKILGRNL